MPSDSVITNHTAQSKHLPCSSYSYLLLTHLPQLEPKKEENVSLPYSLNPDLCLLRSVRSGVPSTLADYEPPMCEETKLSYSEGAFSLPIWVDRHTNISVSAEQVQDSLALRARKEAGSATQIPTLVSSSLIVRKTTSWLVFVYEENHVLRVICLGSPQRALYPLLPDLWA